MFWGTSSWNYAGWEGLVYQDVSSYGKHFVRDSIREYVQHKHFDCVGIDRFFYGPPSEKSLALLRARLPAGFPLVIKAPKQLTYPVDLDSNGQPDVARIEQIVSFSRLVPGFHGGTLHAIYPPISVLLCCSSHPTWKTG